MYFSGSSFWRSKRFVYVFKQQAFIKHSCALLHGSVLLLYLSRKRTRNSYFEWILLDLLINVYHLFPRPSFPPPYLLTKWISFNVKLLHLIQVNFGIISEAPSLVSASYKQYIPPMSTLCHNSYKGWRSEKQPAVLLCTFILGIFSGYQRTQVWDGLRQRKVTTSCSKSSNYIVSGKYVKAIKMVFQFIMMYVNMYEMTAWKGSLVEMNLQRRITWICRSFQLYGAFSLAVQPTTSLLWFTVIASFSFVICFFLLQKKL